MAEGKPKKAYYVWENWTMTKSLLVFAESADEAKRKVREPRAEDFDDIEGLDTSGQTPKGIRVRRAPGEDK